MKTSPEDFSFYEFFPPQGLLVDEDGQTEVADKGVKKVRIVQEMKATRSGERSNSSDGYDSKEVIF